MRGAVEVGPAPFPDTSLPRVSSVGARVSGSAVTVSFRVSETARVKVGAFRPKPQEHHEALLERAGAA